jgi:hypothetical protein
VLCAAAGLHFTYPRDKLAALRAAPIALKDEDEDFESASEGADGSEGRRSHGSSGRLAEEMGGRSGSGLGLGFGGAGEGGSVTMLERRALLDQRGNGSGERPGSGGG